MLGCVLLPHSSGKIAIVKSISRVVRFRSRTAVEVVVVIGKAKPPSNCIVVDNKVDAFHVFTKSVDASSALFWFFIGVRT